MLADEVRMRSYLQAILKAVKPGDVVLDIGSGTGILAYFACIAGASHVYAVEQDPLVGLAERICHQNGFQDRVTFINDWSDQVELPRPVDVIVTETIGNMGFEEGILGWIIDARDRLLVANGRIVPQTVELLMAPTADPQGFDILGGWEEESYTLDLSPVGDIVSNNLIWGSLSPKAFLSEPATVASADLTTVTSADINGEGYFIANRNGDIHGIGCWFRATLVHGITISNGPPFNTPSWMQILMPLQQPLAVKADDSLHARIQATDNGAHWQWQIGVEERSNGKNGQTTLSGQFLSSGFADDPASKPRRSAAGEVDLYILQMMDGSIALDDMARRAFDRFPLQFCNINEATEHVGHIVEYYGRQTKISHQQSGPVS